MKLQFPDTVVRVNINPKATKTQNECDDFEVYCRNLNKFIIAELVLDAEEIWECDTDEAFDEYNHKVDEIIGKPKNGCTFNLMHTHFSVVRFKDNVRAVFPPSCELVVCYSDNEFFDYIMNQMSGMVP